MTPTEAALALRRRAVDLRARLVREERFSILDLLSTADRLSSGPLNRSALARAKHPYARRHGAPQLNPAIINAQSGVFRRSWQGEGPVDVDGDLYSVVENTAPHAGYLESGTRRMFARPVHKLAEAQVAPRRQARLARAIRQAME